jgi:hypothetical protein
MDKQIANQLDPLSSMRKPGAAVQKSASFLQRLRDADF